MEALLISDCFSDERIIQKPKSLVVSRLLATIANFSIDLHVLQCTHLTHFLRQQINWCLESCGRVFPSIKY